MGHFKILYNEELMYIRCTKCANSSLTEFFLNNNFNLICPKSRKQHIEIITLFKGETIAITRNPFSRLVSAFSDKQNPKVGIDDELVYIQNTFPSWYKMGIRHDTNIDTFVDMVSEIPDYKIDHHLSSQSYRYYNKRGNLIVDTLIDISCLNERIGDIKDKYNLKGSLKTINKVPHESYIEILQNEKTIQKIYERYKLDFQLFNYTF